MVSLVWLIPALPLLGFLILLLVGPRLGEPVAGWLATAMVVGRLRGVDHRVHRAARPAPIAPTR